MSNKIKSPIFYMQLSHVDYHMLEITSLTG